MSHKKNEDYDESNPNNKWQKLAEEALQAEESDLSAETGNEEITENAEIEFTSREELETKLTLQEKETIKYKEQALRTQAEMDNLRRRTDRDITSAVKFGSEKLLADLLPVADSLSHALEVANKEEQDSKLKAMREGIQLTLDLLLKTLEKNGVTQIAPQIGEAFNPQLHEAMTMQEVPEVKSNTILQVFQPGYELNGRVLRAARVVVAK